MNNDLWYSLPLVISVSLVYAATRDEDLGPILLRAVRVGAWIIGLMAVIFAGLFLISWNL